MSSGRMRPGGCVRSSVLCVAIGVAILPVLPSARAAAPAAPPEVPAPPGAPADSLGFDAAASFADTLAALDRNLASLQRRRSELAAPDLVLFDALVASAREIYDGGDVEAAVLLVEDARMLLRGEAP